MYQTIWFRSWLNKAMTTPERGDLRPPHNFFARRFHPDTS